MKSSLYHISSESVLLSLSSFHSKANNNKQTNKSQSIYIHIYIMNYFIRYICKYIKIQKHLLNNYLLWNDWKTTWLYLTYLHFNELYHLSYCFTNYSPTLMCSLHLIFVHCLSQAHKTIPWIYSCQINRQNHGNCMYTPCGVPIAELQEQLSFG